VYEYDVFISYLRPAKFVSAWVETHFYPLLSEILDNNLRGGADWPSELQLAMRHTRILLPVCSPKYFVNELCLAEWQSMEQREELYSTVSGKPQLIYPVIFCDSENFPEFTERRRMHDLNEWSMHEPQFQDTLAYLDFHKYVAGLAQELEKLIDQAPEWRPDWPVATPEAGRLPSAKFPRL
jgi:hypothetical protein